MKSIIDKYLRGKTTGLEDKELYNWLKKNNANINIFKREITSYMLNYSNDEKVDSQKAFDEFETAIKNRGSKRVRTFIYKKHFKYAAALAILISSAYFIKKGITSTWESNQVITDSSTNINLNDRIILTRNNGTKQVIQEEKKELSYLKPHSDIKLAFNELKVPNGKIFRLVLSDSTIVWLNSDTKLKYPETFINSLKTRTVYLEGEAFFEVSHDRNKPFIVNTNGVDVKVLGTKFNVSSYNEDEQIRTTLVEGSVNVIDKDSQNSIIIKPSFQASFQKTSRELTSVKVNPSDYTSWMQKRIIFKNTPFNELIAKIERTYNVKIINENENIKNEHFTGQFDVEDIETIFKALSTSYYFEYKIENKSITIKDQRL